jgi:hypothetical protein
VLRRGWLRVGLALLIASGSAAGIYWSMRADRADGFAPAAELSVRRAVKSEVKGLFASLDLEGLEALAAKYRATRERTPSGIWKLTLFYSALHEVVADVNPADEEAWQALNENLRVWRGEQPESPTPIIASAIAFKRLAWNSRPSGLLQEASASSEDRFVVALNGALGFLESYREIASKDPHFYVVWAGLAAALGTDEARFLSRMEEGIAREPGYYQLYFAALDAFADESRPERLAKPIEAFANLAVERTRSKEGLGLYARLYWYASNAFWKERIFEVSKADWPRLRQGMEDVMARYPDDWNTSHFARLACLKGDLELTASLLARLPAKPLEKVWHSRQEFAHCAALARGGA